MYRKAVEANPDYAEGRNNLGGALWVLGRFDEAVEQFELALKLNPHMEQAQQNLARARAREREHQAGDEPGPGMRREE